MKTTILLILLLTLSPVSAITLEDCNDISNFAATVMRSRQANIDMVKVIQVVQDNDDAAKDAMEFIVKDAYSQPGYSTIKYKTKAIMQFKNKYFLECYK